jgi:hypothetical protein
MRSSARYGVVAVLIAAAAVAALAVKTPAGESTPAWRFDDLKRLPHELNVAERAAASQAGVEVSSITEVARSGDLVLLAGVRRNEVCFGSSRRGSAMSYSCMGELEAPIAVRVAGSGRGKVVSSYELVGLARSDVREVLLDFAGLPPRTLYLRPGGLFTFRGPPVPVLIKAVLNDGTAYTQSIGLAGPTAQ